MPRYSTYGDLDDRPIIDGDSAFLKFASRRQSTLLEPGTLELSENWRLDRTTARVRKGLQSVSTDIVLSNPPLLLDFTLGTDLAATGVTRASTTATLTTVSAHGLTTGDMVEVRGFNETEYNGDFTVTVTGSDTFEYTVSGSPSTPGTGSGIVNIGAPLLLTTYDSVARASCVFATNDNDNDEWIIVAANDSAWAIRDGESSVEIDYPANETVEATDDASLRYWNGSVYLFRGHQTAAALAVSSITRSGGTATVTTSSNHGLETGDWAFIQGAAEVAYNGIFQITKTGATTFTYTVSFTPTTPATGTITARPCKVPLVWNGNFSNDFVAVTSGAVAGSGTLIRMPPCGWGVDFKNRLVVPYDRDELLLSDVYDGTSFDAQYNELRIRGGTDDWLVGVHPYQNNQLLVFYRKSIHLVTLSENDLSIAEALEITRDIGCASRRSIVTCGDKILWLSDRGIMGLQIGDLLSLRQAQKPLSDDVDDIIQRINYGAIGKVAATYWDNRYYIALPLDDSTLAARVLIYNFLNGGWESLDEYPDGFDVENFHQIEYNGTKRLHCTTTYGFAYVMEENEVDVWGNTISQSDVDIPATLNTRYYTGKSLEPKRFRRFSLEGSFTQGDTFDATVATKNPDETTVTTTVVAAETTDKFLRIRGRGVRGTGVQLRIESTAGRPEIRYVQAEFVDNEPRGERTYT